MLLVWTVTRTPCGIVAFRIMIAVMRSLFVSATLDKTQFRDFRARARHILREEFRDDPLIVLKDPRICQLVPFWLEVLGFAGFTPRLILTHRNPVDVAASLNRRNGFDLSLGLWIWLNHVLAAEIATRGMTRVFTSYDRVMRDWQHEAGRIEQGLGVTLPGLVDGAAAQVGDFLSPDLKHFGSDARTTLKNPALPGWIARVFSTLDRWAEGGERASCHSDVVESGEAQRLQEESVKESLYMKQTILEWMNLQA